MNPGELNKRISILKEDDNREWSPEFQRWAKVSYLRWNTLFKAAQEFGDLSCVMTVRFTKEINYTKRIKYDGKEFDIKNCIPVENKRYLEIYCSEVF